METKAKLGVKAIGRRELKNNEGYGLKEPQSPYNLYGELFNEGVAQGYFRIHADPYLIHG